jgi:transposase InsO family protein
VAIPSGSCAAHSQSRPQATTPGPVGKRATGRCATAPCSLPSWWPTRSRGKPTAVPASGTPWSNRATTPSQHRFPVAANTLDRAFTVEALRPVWAGDLTYVWTLEGWLYLAILRDLSSRRVVDWAMGQQLTVELALTMALANRAPTAGLLHHSDRGSQSAATSYQRILAAYGLRPSMSRKGNCGDNACVESFFGTLSVSGSIIGATPHETKPSRTSSNISRCSIIGSDGTRLSAITPRPSMKRGRQSLNQVSTELGEGHPEDSGIADNLRGHNMAEIKGAVEAVEGTHPLSSTYSPDLNPIEQLFAKLHALLRTTATRTWTGTGIKPVAACRFPSTNSQVISHPLGGTL